MAKLTLSDLASLQNETSAIATLNDNNDALETALENTLSRDGTSPNTMGDNLDMNSNRILNLPAPILGSEPVRLSDIDQSTISINTQVTSYTLVLTDANSIVELNSSSANTLTIPTNATVAFPTATRIDIVQIGTGQTTITPAAGVVIRSVTGAVKLFAQYSGASLYKRDTNEWVLTGDLTL